MTALSNATTVDDAFFNPIEDLVASSRHLYPCPEFPDWDFVRLAIHRVLECSPSGRGFLQEHGLRFENAPSLSNYFATLRSARRGQLIGDVHSRLSLQIDADSSDHLAGIPGLDRYECFAADAHWHLAAAHDPRHEESKMAVGHCYSLNLRSHSLRHLAAAQGVHEHDMSMLRRIKPRGLRQGVPKGRRVIIVYDKAGIDFAYWARCRQECAVYFVSRVKKGMAYDWLRDRDWDRTEPQNAGVQQDRAVMTREGIAMRIVVYVDPVSGGTFEFLTNEPDLLPGVIAELYRRRWEAEKVFDEIKNKFGERKAWGTSQAAREAQARCVAITHNLVQLYTRRMEEGHRVVNRIEDARRLKRTEEAKDQCARSGRALSTLVTAARRASQHSLKFVRWLRQSLRDRLTEDTAVPRLRTLYATW